MLDRLAGGRDLLGVHLDAVPDPAHRRASSSPVCGSMQAVRSAEATVSRVTLPAAAAPAPPRPDRSPGRRRPARRTASRSTRDRSAHRGAAGRSAAGGAPGRGPTARPPGPAHPPGPQSPSPAAGPPAAGRCGRWSPAPPRTGRPRPAPSPGRPGPPRPCGCGCPCCGGPAWPLDHAPGGGYLGLSHGTCNTRAGGRVGNAVRYGRARRRAPAPLPITTRDTAAPSPPDLRLPVW
jgi:hypothetical protein